MSKNRHIVRVTTKLIIDTENDTDLDQVLSDMDYNFTSRTEDAEIVDTEIYEQEIVE